MPHRIAFLVFPGFQLLDAAGPIAAFEVAGRAPGGLYVLRVVSARAGGVASSSGVVMQAGGLPRQRSFDTLVVAGGDGVDTALADSRLLGFVRRAVNGGARVASVCSGSLLLAAAGVLDGRAATTHWGRTRQFREQYPQVRLEADRIFVKDGEVWTSAGISAGIDLALAMIREDLGDQAARRVAQQLVVYHRRPGGQSQFSALLEMGDAGGRFAQLLDEVRRRLDQRHSVADLAALACMSERHFARAFLAETGVSPAKAVERLRVEAARAALESGAVSVQRVAASCGFGDAERMRRSFQRLLGLPPTALKRGASRQEAGRVGSS